MTLAQKIQEITRRHLKEENGVALGQCLTAVGWVAGTVPEMTEDEGIIELATSDVSNSGIAVGLALAGRRPIYIVRYQGFQWYNAVSIVNYAAKSKEIWGVPCPVFVRSIGMEGAIGPVASNSHHGLIMRMPGISITAPMTVGEYEHVWDHFMKHDDPMYVSEHRMGFQIDYEMEHREHQEADITLIAISASRLAAVKAAERLDGEGMKVNVYHLVWLKPFVVDATLERMLRNSKFGGVILDGDYEDGVAKPLAFNCYKKTGADMDVLALENRSAGFAPHLDNLPPSVDKIIARVRNIIAGK